MLIVMPKNVSEIMTVKIETIGLEDTAQAAARKMKEKNISSLVVMDVNNQAVGIVTERDLVTQVCCQRKVVRSTLFDTSCLHLWQL